MMLFIEKDLQRGEPYRYISPSYSNLLFILFSRNDKRYSMGSTAETYTDTLSASRHSQQAMITPGQYDESPYGQRYLDAPRPGPAAGSYNFRDSSPSNSSNGLSRSAEDEGFTPPTGYSANEESEPIIPRQSQQGSTSADPTAYVRQGVPAPAYTSETQNAYRYVQPQAVSYDQQPYPAYVQEPEPVSPQLPPPRGLPRPSHARSQSRGVTLTDPGVVPAADSVRRVARNGKRSSTSMAAASSQQGPSNPRPASRASRTSTALPPGAAPPQYPRY